MADIALSARENGIRIPEQKLVLFVFQTIILWHAENEVHTIVNNYYIRKKWMGIERLFTPNRANVFWIGQKPVSG